MNAKQFLESKGQLARTSVRFLNAGEPTDIPLAELLEEYASRQSAGHALKPVDVIPPVKEKKAKVSAGKKK